jgi:hypothetical protein
MANGQEKVVVTLMGLTIRFEESRNCSQGLKNPF